MPDEDSLAERAETASAHLSGRLQELQGNHPDAFEDTVQGVLAITRQLDQADPDREELLEELFAVLGEDPLVVTADHSVEDGRIHVTGAVEGTTGAGLFRPDPEAVAEAHAEPPDPSLGEVSVTEEAIIARNAVLPDGGHLAVVTTSGTPLGATEYRALGEYDELTVSREHFETDSGEAHVMLFKGAPDEEFTLSNTPYSHDRQLVGEEVEL